MIASASTDKTPWLLRRSNAEFKEFAQVTRDALDGATELDGADRIAILAWALGAEIASQGKNMCARQFGYDIANRWVVKVCNEYGVELDAASDAGRQ